MWVSCPSSERHPPHYFSFLTFCSISFSDLSPLLAATALPYIALLFHDVDTLTGLFIHIFPPMEAYALRWHSDEIRERWPQFFHLNYLDSVHFLPLEGRLAGSVAGNTLILYALWFILYLIWMLGVGLDLPRKDRKGPGGEPKYDTCFHAFMRGGACLVIGETLWRRPRAVSRKQVETNHFERRDVLVHMTYHACMALASIFILGYACYTFKVIHGAALTVMTTIAVRRGAKRYSYYATSLYSRTLEKHFNILLPEGLAHSSEEEVDADEDLDCLEYLFQLQVRNLRTRIGLVPNYFITRGESIPPNDQWTAEGICRRAVSWFLKLFQPVDFRDLETHDAFVDTVVNLSHFVENGTGSVSDRAASILNQPLDRHGNTALHLLVMKRQLKFIKSLLLNCGTRSLDLNKCNASGQSALDFAVDRLEVETVFLLRLFGAKAPNENAPNSLGYAEYLSVDLIANLDTGRALNRKSIEAIMQHVFDSNLSIEELLQWAYGHDASELSDATVASLGHLPQLYALTLADGCDAITNHEAFATLVRMLFTIHLHFHTYSDSNNLVQDDARNVLGVEDLPTPTVCTDLHALLEDRDIDVSSQKVAGRTLFFRTKSGNRNRQYALKLSKAFEENKTPHPLSKEAAMDASMTQLKERLRLKSEYPSNCELITIKCLPQQFREAVEGQRSQGFHRFEVSNKSDGITALLYCPPKGYTEYVNDPELSLPECRAGILNATFDYACLARNGLMHGTLIDIQHDMREGRPHLWSFESFLTRFRGGAGRIARGFAGLAAPNVRASGLGDLKHILNKSQVIARYDPSHIHAQHNILYDHQERFQVSLIEQLGAGLFASCLLVASSWEGRNRLNIGPNIHLAEMLEEVFVEFLCGYLQVQPDRAKGLLKLMGTNFHRMANQMALFATGEYVEIAESSRARPLFGIAAKVLGWLTHPTAFVHFMQRGDRDLSKPGCSIQAIRSVYESSPEENASNILLDGYPRVDTSMMRCSPTWVKGRGWASSEGQPHFGSYEGVLPFQQLIRDLYSVTYLTSLILLAEMESSPTVECDDGKERSQ